jgi:hypothetical protein
MVDIVDLRNLVAEAEGTTDERAAQKNFASGYDLPFGYGRYLQPSKPISQMTFQELGDFQRRQVNATKGTFNNTNEGTSAVGRYQFIGSTLENLKNRLGYKDTDVFSPEVQDRLFDALMEEQGLQELSAGLITPEKFQEKLSSQFAGIPKPGTETGTYKGQGTGVTSDRVSAVLSSMQADTQTDQMLSQEQPGGTFRPEDDTVPSDTGTVTGDQAEEEPGFLDTVGEYVGDAYDTVSEYVSETVDTLERVAESVGEKLRRLLGSEEEQSNTSVDNPPIPEPRPERRPVAVDNPPIPEPRPKQADVDFSDVVDFVGTLKKAEGGSVEKEVEFVKEDDDDDDVPDPPPGATPEEVADDIPAYLSTGEYVLPANVVRYIGLKNITDMHQRALAELQQMEDLDIIENVDENGYVEEDDDEMDYMKPEGVVEIVVAEHHPKGLMVQDAPRGSGGIASLPRMAEIQGQYHVLSYLTPEEQQMLRDAGGGLGLDGAQIYGPGGVPAFPEPGMGGSNDHGGSVGGTSGGGTSGGGKGGGGKGGGGSSASSSSKAGDEDDATDPGAATAAQAESPLGGMIGDINEALGFARDHGFAGKGVTDPSTGWGPQGQVSVSRSYTEKDVRDPKSVATAVGMGLGSIAGGLAGIGQAAVNAAIEAGIDVQEATTTDPLSGGGSQEFYEEEKADTDTEKTTDTDPLSDYIYVPGVGYRRRVKSVKPLSKLKAGGYVSKKGIMAKGYDKGGDVGDPGGGPGGPLEYEPEPEPEVIEEEKPTDPYEGYTYVKGIGYVPTSRRATSNKPIESASLALSSIFTPGFLSTIGLMSDPNKEL